MIFLAVSCMYRNILWGITARFKESKYKQRFLLNNITDTKCVPGKLEGEKFIMVYDGKDVGVSNVSTLDTPIKFEMSFIIWLIYMLVVMFR